MNGFDGKIALLKMVRAYLCDKQKRTTAKEEAEAAFYARNANYAYAYVN